MREKGIVEFFLPRLRDMYYRLFDSLSLFRQRTEVRVDASNLKPIALEQWVIFPPHRHVSFLFGINFPIGKEKSIQH